MLLRCCDVRPFAGCGLEMHAISYQILRLSADQKPNTLIYEEESWQKWNR